MSTENLSTPSNRENTPVPSPIGKRALITLGALCLLSLLAHLVFYPQLPDLVPLNWGPDGSVDNWGGRESALLLDALPLLCLAVFYIAPKIDPRGRAYGHVAGFYTAFVIGFTLFMIGVSWSIELTVFGIMPEHESPIGTIVSVALGVGIMFLGNYLPRVPRNYTFGIKTPWALDNDLNWRLTHRFGGAATMLMGLSLMITGLFINRCPEALPPLFIIAIFGFTGAIFVYSYLVFRNGNMPLRKR